MTIASANGYSSVKVTSMRGYIRAVALVTKRIKPFRIDGKTVHMVGIPLHWGFTGLTSERLRLFKLSHQSRV